MSSYTKISVPAEEGTWSTHGTTSNTRRLFEHGFPYGPNGYALGGTSVAAVAAPTNAPDDDYTTVYWVNHVMNCAPELTPLGLKAPNYKANYWGLPYFNPRFGPPKVPGTNKKDMSLIVFDGDPVLTPPGVWAEDKDHTAVINVGIGNQNVSLPPIIPFVPNPALPEGITNGYDATIKGSWLGSFILGSNKGVTTYFVSAYEKMMGGANILTPAESIRGAQYASPYSLLEDTSSESSITMPSLAMGKSSYTVANTTIL
jgi:hypothetical protein